MQDNENAGIDLSQFYQIFFEEAAENLDQMEQMLLQLDLEHAENEELNAIFRCAHSIKGGAATFGFSDVAALTHQMESLLDKLRQRQLDPTAAMVDVLLQSSDALRSQLACHQGNGGTPADTGDLLRSIQEMAASGAAAGASTGAANAAAASPPAQAPQAIESHSDQNRADTAPSQSNAGASATPAATATAHQPRDLIIRFGPMDGHRRRRYQGAGRALRRRSVKT
jgi:two-component system, chemotaxis family, sensor kinase CheA